MNKWITKITQLDKSTLVRSVLLIVSHINQIVAFVGQTSFASSTVYQVASLIFTLVMSTIAAWKNNDFTHIAQLSTEVYNSLKDGKLEESEIKELLNKAETNINN